MDIIAGAVSGLGDTAVKLRTAITGKDPALDAQLQTLAAGIDAAKSKAETDLMSAQIEVNKQEAANQNIFVSGWRPFIGWVCGIAFALNFLLFPVAQWIVQMFNILGADGQPLKLFEIDLATMLPVLLGMLGLGAARTVEKINNAAGNH